MSIRTKVDINLGHIEVSIDGYVYAETHIPTTATKVFERKVIKRLREQARRKYQKEHPPKIIARKGWPKTDFTK